MLLVGLLKWVEDGRCVFSVFVSEIEEVDGLTHCSVLNDNHVLCQLLQQRNQTPFRIEPCVSVELS